MTTGSKKLGHEIAGTSIVVSKLAKTLKILRLNFKEINNVTSGEVTKKFLEKNYKVTGVRC